MNKQPFEELFNLSFHEKLTALADGITDATFSGELGEASNITPEMARKSTFSGLLGMFILALKNIEQYSKGELKFVLDNVKTISTELNRRAEAWDQAYLG